MSFSQQEVKEDTCEIHGSEGFIWVLIIASLIFPIFRPQYAAARVTLRCIYLYRYYKIVITNLFQLNIAPSNTAIQKRLNHVRDK